MTTIANFSRNLSQNLGHTPTTTQDLAIGKLSAFVNSSESDQVFILRGYAGTGKTTLVSALVKSLPQIRMKSVLLAPTGRAAKVLSGYSEKQAFTIHKKIYFQNVRPDGGVRLVRKENMHTRTIFIVDEASMISESSNEDGSGGIKNHDLLADLLEYVYSGSTCKLIFVGDTAQLPPVGKQSSPALESEHIESAYGLQCENVELTDVVRQAEKSGILTNATAIRDLIRDGKPGLPKLDVAKYKDIYRMNGDRLEDGIQYAYDKFGQEDSIIICRSNKTANLFNKQIRARILYREEELSAGDLLMVVRNNYSWLPEDSQAGFIANGDIAEILRVRRYIDRFGFRFAEVNLKLLDYPDMEDIECTLMMDTLFLDGPSLPYSRAKELYESVAEDYLDIGSKKARNESIKKDPFYNALQVKFAYAVTCHKAQGGQWKAAFVEQGFLRDDDLNIEYLRWLYTAVTRASHELFLLNFHPSFFNDFIEEENH